MRTTFDRKDLVRAAKAPHKVYGLYEQLGTGSLKNLPSPSSQLDSGLGDELPTTPTDDNPRPTLLGVPPSALVDTENHDSGLGAEATVFDDDDVVPDRVSSSTVAPQKAGVVPERPRKPKTTRAFHPSPSYSTSLPSSHPSASAEFAASTVRLTPPPQPHTTLPTATPSSPHQLTREQIACFIPNKDGDTGLHLSIIHNHTRMFETLLDWASATGEGLSQSLLDEQNSLFQTPLHLATHTQQTDMMRKLLIAGASPHLTDHRGNTPMHIACKFNSTKCLDEILRYTSLRNIRQIAQLRNNDGLTCVHVAVYHNSTDAIRKLRSMGVDLNAKEFHSGKTALHIAVEKNSLSTVQFLVDKCQVYINATTYSSCTPLHIAAGRGNIIMSAYLLSMGANPQLLTDEGDRPIDLSISNEVTELLTRADQVSQLL